MSETVLMIVTGVFGALLGTGGGGAVVAQILKNRHEGARLASENEKTRLGLEHQASQSELERLDARLTRIEVEHSGCADRADARIRAAIEEEREHCDRQIKILRAAFAQTVNQMQTIRGQITALQEISEAEEL